MKVLQVVLGDLGVPALKGGAVQQTTDVLSRYLADRGVEVTVISPISEADFDQFAARHHPGVDYRSIPPCDRTKPTAMMLQAIRALGSVKIDEFDVIHAHSPYSTVAARIFVRKRKRPKVIWHVHNAFRFGRVATPMSDLVVGVSWRVIELTDSSMRKPTKVILTGKDLSEFRPSDQTSVEHDVNRPPTILYVGRLSPEKGLHVLLDACKILARRNVDFELVVVGGKWFGTGEGQDDYVRTLTQRSREFRCRWLGYVNNWEMPRVYSCCTVLVVPSVWEDPAPQVVLEGLASGCPVVASRIGGIPELIKHDHNGLLVLPGDSMALAESIDRLLRSPEDRARLGINARTGAMEFSWDRIVDQWLRTYEELLA